MMVKRSVVLTMACLILAACSDNTPIEQPAWQPVEKPPKPYVLPVLRPYNLQGEFFDHPEDTQVRLALTVPKDTTKEEVRELLEWLFDAVTHRRGFRHGDKPSKVYLVVYYDPPVGDPELWDAMLEYVPEKNEPGKPTIYLEHPYR